MDDLSSHTWAKLVALRPENKNISFIAKPDEPNLHQVDGEWKISQDADGGIKIVCLSASCIKVDDTWLGMNQENKLQGGEMIAFSEEKNMPENSFDYVFCLTNVTPAEGLKRKRDENDESKGSLLLHKIKRFMNELNQELHCAICLEIVSDCTTLIPCLHYFCNHCITKLLKSQTECPLCRTKIKSMNKNLFIQRLLDSSISVLDVEKFQESTKIIKESSTALKNETSLGDHSSDGKTEEQGQMTYKDGSVYEGGLKIDQREGKGTLTHPSGNIFKGEWRNDILQPYAQIQYLNGGYYFGEVKDLERHGNGFMIYPNTSTYEGSWSKDQREGWGKQKDKNRTYEGNWMDDKMNGHGKIKFSDGSILEGNWREGSPSGIATLTQTNGDILKGKWTHNNRNQFSGQGEINFANGGQFEGSWRRFSQKLVLYFGGAQYEGEVSSNEIRQFNILYKSGSRFTGMIEMKHLKKQGKGKMRYCNGDEYDGDWKNDFFHGTGKYSLKHDGSVYEGQYVNGKRNGRGTITDRSGIKWTGEWKDGEKVIKKELVEESSTKEN